MNKFITSLLFLFVYVVIIEIATLFIDYEYLIAGMLGLIYYEISFGSAENE